MAAGAGFPALLPPSVTSRLLGHPRRVLDPAGDDDRQRRRSGSADEHRGRVLGDVDVHGAERLLGRLRVAGVGRVGQLQQLVAAQLADGLVDLPGVTVEDLQLATAAAEGHRVEAVLGDEPVGEVDVLTVGLVADDGHGVLAFSRTYVRTRHTLQLGTVE